MGLFHCVESFQGTKLANHSCVVRFGESGGLAHVVGLEKERHSMQVECNVLIPVSHGVLLNCVKNVSFANETVRSHCIRYELEMHDCFGHGGRAGEHTQAQAAEPDVEG